MPDLFFNQYLPGQIDIPQQLPTVAPLDTGKTPEVNVDFSDIDLATLSGQKDKPVDTFEMFYGKPDTTSNKFKLQQAENIVPYSAKALEPYFFSNDYKELGFLPGKDMTNLYEAKTGVMDALTDWVPALWDRITTAVSGDATQTFKNIDAISKGEIDAFWSKDAAQTSDSHDQQFRITHPTLNYQYDDTQNSNWKYVPGLHGSGSWWRNMIPELGFTIGTMAYTVGENLVVDALTGAETLGITPAYEASKGIKSMYGALRGLYNSGRFLENAKNVFEEASLAQKTISGLKSAYYGYNVLRGAMSEAGMEGGQAYMDTKKKLLAQYKDTNGYDAVGDDLDKIEKSATDAGNLTFGLNIPVLTASNLIQFKSLLWPSSSIEDAAEKSILKGVKLGVEGEGLEQKIVRTAATTTDKLKHISSIFAPMSEGVEEISQLGIQNFSQSYYESIYNGVSSPEAFKRASSQAKDSVMSREGFENFFGGIIGGYLFEGIGKLAGVSGIQDRIANATNGIVGYSERTQERLKDERITELVDYLNKTGPSNFVNKNFANNLLQGNIADNIDNALLDHNSKLYHDEQSKSLREFIYSGILTGKLDFRLDQMKELKTLSDEDFAKAIGEDVTPEIKNKFHEAIDNVVSKGETLQKNYSRVENTFRNISFDKSYQEAKTNLENLSNQENISDNELKSAQDKTYNILFQREAFEMAKKDLVFSLSDVENNAKDLDNIYSKISNNYSSNIGIDTNELDSVVDSKKRQQLKESLRSDINSLKSSISLSSNEDKKQYQQELKEKESKLELLQDNSKMDNLTPQTVYDYFSDKLNTGILTNGILHSEVLDDFDSLLTSRDKYNKSIGILDFITNPNKISKNRFNKEAFDIETLGNTKIPAGFKQLSQYHYYALNNLVTNINTRLAEQQDVNNTDQTEENPLETQIPVTNQVVNESKDVNQRINDLRERSNLKGWNALYTLASLATNENKDLTILSRQEYVSYAKDNLIKLSKEQIEANPQLRVAKSEEERQSILDNLISEITPEELSDFNEMINEVVSIAKLPLDQRIISNGIRVLPSKTNSIYFAVNSISDITSPIQRGIALNLNLSELNYSNIQSFLEALQVEDFNGQIKINKDLVKDIIPLDHQIEIINSNDSNPQDSLILKVAKEFFADSLKDSFQIYNINTKNDFITDAQRSTVYHTDVDDILEQRINDLEESQIAEEDKEYLEELAKQDGNNEQTRDLGNTIINSKINLNDNFNFIVEADTISLIDPLTGNKLDNSSIKMTEDEKQIYDSNNLLNNASRKSANLVLAKSIYNRNLENYSTIVNQEEVERKYTLEEYKEQLTNINSKDDFDNFTDNLPVEIFESLEKEIDSKNEQLLNQQKTKSKIPFLDIKDDNGKIASFPYNTQFSFENKIWNIDRQNSINGELHLQNRDNSSEKIRITDLNSVSLYTPGSNKVNNNIKQESTLMNINLRSLPDFNGLDLSTQSYKVLDQIDFTNIDSIKQGVSQIVDIVNSKHISEDKIEQVLKTKSKLIGNNDYYTKDYLEQYITLSTKDFSVQETSNPITEEITNNMSEEEKQEVVENIENVGQYLKENADTIINNIRSTNSEDASKNFFDSTCK